MSASYSKGLEGVVAGQTSICTVGRQGDDLRYRGYSIEDLCERATWEEVAYVLVKGERPNAEQLAEWQKAIAAGRRVPDPLLRLLHNIPADTHPMDVLRTGFSYLGNLEPEDKRDTQEILPRLLGIGPSLIAAWHCHHQGLPAKFDYPHSDQGGYFLYALRGGKMPTDEERQLMDDSLLLYAEHGFNASTFCARVVTATLSDVYSAVVAAVGTLKGPLHGGANEKAMELILRFDSVDAAEKGIRDALARKEKIMGFGHRVYKVQDPRNPIIKAWSERLSKHHPDKPPYHQIAEKIDEVVSREKKLFPNADFYHATAYYYLGIPIPLYTPIFVFGRMAGWLAHILEQRADNRIIRPTEEYIGPEARAWE
jgi:2-methylcitrate synthase